MKRTAALLAAAAFIATPALAQSSLTEVNDDVMVPQFSMDVDSVEDMDVYDSAGTEIGEVEEVLGSNEQTPTHLAIDFSDDDGSTYPDTDNSIVSLDDVSFTDGRIVVNLTPEEVSALQSWDD